MGEDAFDISRRERVEIWAATDQVWFLIEGRNGERVQFSVSPADAMDMATSIQRRAGEALQKTPAER